MNDQSIQALMLQAEAAPPSVVWENLALVLDELEADKNTAQLVLGAEVSPPSDLWNLLETVLEETEADSRLQQRISLLEEQPPLDFWQRIEQQMLEEQIGLQLREAERTPPLNSWSSIEAQLPVTAQTPVITLPKKGQAFYRYLAAASLIGLMFWGGYQLFKKSTSDNNIATNQEIIPEAVLPDTTPIAPVTTTNKEDLLNKQNTKPATQMLAAVQSKKRTNSQTSIHTTENVVTLNDIKHKQPITQTSTTGFKETNYLLVIDDNGDLIRVSKKLAAMKCANPGIEMPVDAVAALNSKNCDNQIKEWQEKIAKSTAISSTGGIFDLEEIIRTTEK
jgi:hypothetical protein